MRGVVLGIDWDDEVAVRLLAHELVTGGAAHLQALAHAENPMDRARGQLFAFAILMQTTMAESAGEGIHTHGGPVWKALGRAIMQEMAHRPAAPE